jgi:ankyrin repeat protein
MVSFLVLDFKTPIDDGSTPLYIACQNGHLKIVETLLQYDIDVNDSACYDGTTPLHVSCYKGHQQVVELLLEKGADVNTPHQHGGE